MLCNCSGRAFLPQSTPRAQIHLCVLGDLGGEFHYTLAQLLFIIDVVLGDRQGDWHAEQSHWSEAIELYQQAAAIWQSIGLTNLVEQIIQPRLARAREHLAKSC